MAATLFSRPTPSGTTSLGKTTASRSGTSGRSAGKMFPCGSMFVVVVLVSGSVTSISLLVVLARGRVDLDAPRLGALGLRHGELEHAIREVGLDLVRVDLDREREAPGELAGPALLTDPPLVGHVLFLLQLTADGHRVRRRADLEVLRGEAGKIGGQVVGVLRLPQVHRHRDLAAGGHAGPRGGTDEAVLEETIHGLAERDDIVDGVPACESHTGPPLQLNAFSALAISRLAARTFVRHRQDARLTCALRVRPVELVRDLIQQVRGVAELQEHLHPREVDPAGLREISDRAHALEIFVRVEPNVGVGPDWIEQALLLVDPKRPRMAAGETRGDADDVHGSTAACHRDYLKACQWRCQDSSSAIALPASSSTRPPAETLSTRRGPPGLWAGTPSRGGPRLAAVRIAASSLMAMRFGLDFGTSNTSLAVNDGSSTRVLPIDRLVGETMPTVLYIRRDGSALVGREAIEAYLEDNRTRGP